MAKFRAERRVAASHPDSSRTVHSEMFRVCNMRVVAEMSVAPTDSSPGGVTYNQESPAPHQTRAFARVSYLSL